MKTITLLGLLTTLFLIGTSCEKTTIFQSTEKRLIGQWEYEEVKFSKRFSIKNSDITSNYNNLVLELKNDNTIKLSNSESGVETTGVWEIDKDWVYTGDDDGTLVEELEGSLVDFSTGEIELLDWDNLWVRKNKISYTECKDDGTYRVKLVRL